MSQNESEFATAFFQWLHRKICERSFVRTHASEFDFEEDERKPEDESNSDEDGGEEKLYSWICDERNEDEEY
jgi:hypothetical protein